MTSTFVVYKHIFIKLKKNENTEDLTIFTYFLFSKSLETLNILMMESYNEILINYVKL